MDSSPPLVLAAGEDDSLSFKHVRAELKEIEQRDAKKIDLIMDYYGVDSLVVRMHCFIESDRAQTVLMCTLALLVSAVIFELILIFYFPDPSFVVHDCFCCITGFDQCGPGDAHLAPNATPSYYIQPSREGLRRPLTTSACSLALIALSIINVEQFIQLLALRWHFFACPCVWFLDLLLVNANFVLQVLFLVQKKRTSSMVILIGVFLVLMLITRIMRLNADLFTRKALRFHERALAREVRRRHRMLDERRQVRRANRRARRSLAAAAIAVVAPPSLAD